MARTQAGRDCKAYELARDYLLGLPGVTNKVLQRYLRPPRSDTPSTMAEVFLRLLLSLRNKNMMATVIPAEFVHSLGRVLNSFDPVTTTQRFTSADDLLDTIVETLNPPDGFARCQEVSGRYSREARSQALDSWVSSRAVLTSSRGYRRSTTTSASELPYPCS